MKAAVYTRYGPPDVLEIKDVEKPVPADNEVLVRVHATTVCAADWRMRKADPFLIRLMNGLSAPKKIHVLGIEFAGRIESVGRAVTRFREGDEVFGATGFKFGAHAEYVCVPADGVIETKPANMTLEEAAAVFFGAGSALHFLRKAGIRAGQKVLVYGASGSVGVFAVQLAKHFGAHVTGVCSTRNVELVRSLGADEVVDYTKEDFTKPATYDLIFHTVGKISFSACMKSLKKGGVYASDLLLGAVLRKPWASVGGRKRVIGGIAKPKTEDLVFLKDLIEARKLRAVIDRRYPLAQIAEAHRYVEGGHKKGNVVITLS